MAFYHHHIVPKHDCCFKSLPTGKRITLLRGKELLGVQIKEFPEPTLVEISAPILRKDAVPLNEGYRNCICLEERISDRIDKSWALLQASVRNEIVPT